LILAGIQQQVEEALRRFISDQFSVEVGRLVLELPPRIEFGEIACPVAFELAKKLRKPPRAIAQEIASGLKLPDGVARAEAAGAGYVNFFLDRPGLLMEAYRQRDQKAATRTDPGKIIVEHTNINPNKSAHIGHLRNAAIGDSFVRILKFLGHVVEIHNYLDNTGVQVADVVVGFTHLRKMDLAAVRDVSDPFDYYCWDLYAEVTEWFGQDQQHLAARSDTLKQIEEGDNPTAELAEYISTRIVGCHLKTMRRIGVRYDLLPRESEILHLKFWNEAFERLKSSGAVHLSESGPTAGCWVMRLEETEGANADEKIIVRSNGTVTYVGKDIAYQLWKFGLLGLDFHYRPFHTYPEDGHVLWASSLSGEGHPPRFGGASRVYNVIDARQSYLQRVVTEGVRLIGYTEQAANSIHFSYEMVALSPACCEELGYTLSEEDRKRPYVEVSGRKGLGVKADDFIDKLIEKALEEVRTRQIGLDETAQRSIAQKIAVGALRYFLTKYALSSVIAFDFKEALSFDGETGPYLQYSVVRADNIYRKLSDSDPNWRQTLEQFATGRPPSSEVLDENEVWELVYGALRLELMAEQVVETLEVGNLAKYAFALAQQFNFFYHKHHILSETNIEKRNLLLVVADYARSRLLRALELLGIEVPERM